MFTSTVAEAGGFIKSSDEKNIPDIQLHFAPAMVMIMAEHLFGVTASVVMYVY